MSPTQTRLNHITTCLAVTAETLKTLSNSLDTPFLNAISNTTQSLANTLQNVNRNKEDCIQLVEQTHGLLDAIITVHLDPKTGAELPPSVLSQIGKFTETLHKIHTFVEAQQNTSKVKRLLHLGGTNTLLKDCRVGLKQVQGFFQIKTVNIISEIPNLEQEARRRHQEVLDMIEALSEGASSDGTSGVWNFYYR
ncbi:hypothetical protein B0H19DRAFT_1080984 [Mycena capillaripes]|nr:hypothetical protein B0H19DRAFT_1080984 [Mycena capillaripes]